MVIHRSQEGVPIVGQDQDTPPSSGLLVEAWRADRHDSS